MIEHVPLATVVIFSPDTVQTPLVFEARVTVKPEDETAPEPKVTPGAFVPGLLKVMVCELVTKLRFIVYALAL